MQHDIHSGTIAYIRENLDLHLRTGRYSTGLVRELAGMLESRSGSVFAIFDEIAVLEGLPSARPSLTKPPTILMRPPLAGLWHKHYHQASFLPQNILNHWHANNFATHAEKAVNEATVPQDKLMGALIHEFVMGGYRERSQAHRLTGEWIVYARRHDVNTYLTLGTHGGGAAIHERVLACASEFPELKLSAQEDANGR
jgi:hypothetical protein